MTQPILSTVSLCGLALRNRIAVAPMSRMQGDAAGQPGADTAAYYARYARHGAALVITEALYTAGPAARAYHGQPGMACAGHAQAWRAVTAAVHEQGGKIFAQLQHAGKLAEPGLHGRPLAPVDSVAQGLSWQTGRPNAPAHAATAQEIEQIIQGYGESAALAQEAGFDGVEIHGARGYLVHDFTSASNTRKDAWGERARLAEAILATVRSACRLPVSFNYSIYKMDDYHHQPGRGALAGLLPRLRAAGADILHMSARRILRPEPWGQSLAQLAQEVAPGPLIINGGLKTLPDCEEALAATQATLVALARPFLANPDWLDRNLAGHALREYAPGMERLPLLQPLPPLSA
ncbi:NADH:flavin oxidoreductase [Bordetella hinzii]|uniref:NADH:flavin oxidoreductase n=1 Tax=Bordetella hinzii TaxID=103855 RepID=UPI001152A57E|nr:NADH:flavin oxidoreductase [Bordetella hinzii]QDJ31183.1 NADH-dependent flavin oxidoreductase [Bordetella hinzii]